MNQTEKEHAGQVSPDRRIAELTLGEFLQVIGYQPMTGYGAGAEEEEEQIDPETPLTELKLRQLLQILGTQQGTGATWGGFEGMEGAGFGFEDLMADDQMMDFMGEWEEDWDEEGWDTDEDLGDFM
jgi:hypothetical protein